MEERPGFYRLGEARNAPVLYRRDWAAAFARSRAAGETPRSDEVKFGGQVWPESASYESRNGSNKLLPHERDLTVARWRAHQHFERVEQAVADPKASRQRWRRERNALHADEPLFLITEQKPGVKEAVLVEIDRVIGGITWPAPVEAGLDADAYWITQRLVHGACVSLLESVGEVLALLEF